MASWHFRNLSRRNSSPPPFSRLLTLTITILLVQISIEQHISAANRQCVEIYDQEIDEISLQSLFQSSVLSAMSYLQYEKDATGHPWKIDFQTTSPKTTSGSIKIVLLRKVREFRLFVTNFVGFLKNTLYSIPFLRYLLRIIGVIKGNASFDSKSKSGRTRANFFSDERIVESFRLRWFFADWREGLWHDTEVLLGESDNIAFIIFRGSDTAADLLTNSQTMEPASHSFYFGPQEGGFL